MSKRVLIVDDSILMRKMIGDTLVGDGWFLGSIGMVCILHAMALRKAE